MKAKELIKILQEDPEREIVLSRDSEGNGYGALYSVSACKFNKKEAEIGLEELTPDLKAIGYSEDDVMKNGVKAFVLYP